MPRSTAPSATPADASAASQVRAPMNVSASSGPPPRAASASSASRYRGGWTRSRPSRGAGAASTHSTTAASAGARSASHTAAMRSGRSGCPAPAWWRRQAGCQTTSVVMPENPSVVEVCLVQEVPDGFDFGLHSATGGRDLFHRATIAAPRRDNDPSHHRAGDRAQEQGDTLPPNPGDGEEHAVEEEEPDGHGGDGPAGLLPHRTGRRCAGNTMNGALGPAPRLPRETASSSTCAPRNFTL